MTGIVMQKPVRVRPLAALLALLLLFGCTAVPMDAKKPDQAPALRVVTTVFPIYDWAREIAAGVEGVSLTMLQRNGVDPHSFVPTAADMVEIASCDLFVCIGGASDDWARDALKESQNPRRAALFLLESLGDAAKEEVLPSGAEPEPDEPDETEYDEHIWLSLKNASVLTGAIADALCALDPDHAEAYRANAAAYREKLDALDAAYERAVSASENRALVFGDRFPFRYLADDYGLCCYAAFPGCSAESEASFETVLYLADRVDALGLTAILSIETSDGAIARTVRDATKTKDQRLLTLDSMQSVTDAERKAGVTYLAIMERNLAVLTDALNK